MTRFIRALPFSATELRFFVFLAFLTGTWITYCNPRAPERWPLPIARINLALANALASPLFEPAAHFMSVQTSGLRLDFAGKTFGLICAAVPGTKLLVLPLKTPAPRLSFWTLSDTAPPVSKGAAWQTTVVRPVPAPPAPYQSPVDEQRALIGLATRLGCPAQLWATQMQITKEEAERRARMLSVLF